MESFLGKFFFRRQLLVVFLCFFDSMSAGCFKDLITSLEVEDSSITCVIEQEFKDRFLREDFFIEYDEEIDLSSLDYSILTMPCIANLISLVWISGKTYYIDSMDNDLYYSFLRLKKLFKVMYPRTPWEGELIPRKLVEHKPSLQSLSNKRALLFSGGLDSTAVSLMYQDKQQLLITSWGQSDLPLDAIDRWNTVKERIVDYATLYGHDCSFMRSNYFFFLKRPVINRLSKEIINWRIETIEDIGWAGMVAPLLYLKGYSVLSIGSSDTWESSYPSACFPFIDSLITCAGIQFKHEQFELSRPDKVEYIVTVCKEKGLSKPLLRVCSNNVLFNCCECQKCLSTLLTLWLLGEDPPEYGFKVSSSELLQGPEKFIEGLLGEDYSDLTDLLMCAQLQKKIKEILSSEKTVHPVFKTILDFDYRTELFKSREFKFQKKLYWDQLHDMFPFVAIPEQYLSPGYKHVKESKTVSF